MNYPNNTNNNPSGAIPVYSVSVGSSANITTSTGTLVKTGAGSLVGVSINTAGTTSTAKFYDGTDNTGTLLATVSTTAQNYLPLHLAFATGLYVVTAGGAPADITVGYM